MQKTQVFFQQLTFSVPVAVALSKTTLLTIFCSASEESCRSEIIQRENCNSTLSHLQSAILRSSDPPYLLCCNEAVPSETLFREQVISRIAAGSVSVHYRNPLQLRAIAEMLMPEALYFRILMDTIVHGPA